MVALEGADWQKGELYISLSCCFSSSACSLKRKKMEEEVWRGGGKWARPRGSSKQAARQIWPMGSSIVGVMYSGG